jgi:hypothetical protein
MEGFRWLCHKDLVGIGEREIRPQGKRSTQTIDEFLLTLSGSKKIWRTEIKKVKVRFGPFESYSDMLCFKFLALLE